ncbi:endonuclease/exonuclease/phosphatase family protein [Rubellimicrobium aerolatum]|uniref:Endonuclease/exonuclease/phosphatase family protein n=1 Tax=Rubellimicrobium aerolatum TaxID=490979 RepID=A0ABW0S913_9RHOB|nr:endonuclease/exonuclease/phosphatase family protein [Rubellimicrobium aerolatum]MBP1804787.1 endonuclease/exonuclease/phosphatase family metal-dependent hydrolase [Rubellimicrobium aerolatum]
MRLATYNVEWLGRLFDDRGRLLADDAPSGREGVTRREQAEGLAHVLRALDADALLVIEAPDDPARTLGPFARAAGLRARAVLTGFPSGTRQEIALLHDPDRLAAVHDPQGGDPPRFDGTFRADLDGDGRPEPVTWGRAPLEAALLTPRGRALRLIGVHAKSKAPHGARNAAQARRIAIENRRKQLAQCLWLRARVDRHLAAGDPLVVLGDFNDGPGIDEHEAVFGRSGVEIVLGEGPTRLHDPHAARALAGPTAAQPATARFRLPPDEANPDEANPGGRWLSALLDYVMVSPDLRALRPRWRIWHPFDDAACWKDERLRTALLHASDHFPVTLDIDL